MQRKKIDLFSILAIKKSNRKVSSKAGESAYFSNTIQRSGNGPKIRRITIYGGELTGILYLEACITFSALIIIIGHTIYCKVALGNAR